MSGEMILGIDIGSVAVKSVLLDDGNLYYPRYTRIRSTVTQVFLETLDWYRHCDHPPRFLAVTGRGGAGIGRSVGIPSINELFAHGTAALHFNPATKTVIDIGGHDAACVELAEDADCRNLRLRNFSTNSRCAAGTGSFLDQQAVRLGLNIEDEFATLALSADTVPRIAGRCSVFAKSDMIHLQQIATPDSEIVAGLCLAMAESFKSDILRGRTPRFPISFQGGVSNNSAMVHFLRQVFGADEEALFVPRYGAFAGAVGAVLRARFDGKLVPLTDYGDWVGRLEAIPRRQGSQGLSPLPDSSDAYLKSEPGTRTPSQTGFLGIDVGSISTNLVVVDEDGRLRSKCYLMTAGRPIEAVKQGLALLQEELGSRFHILGCGTTGSGRYLTGDIFGADLVKNEITAQAQGAVALWPQVDTIFEIGGQDSKYISLDKGAVVDFTMNKACAAGTGSFLEEQAGLMGISVRDDFARLAFQSQTPSALGQRCTVFIESDLVQKLSQGEEKQDLCAGLAYSIVENYLNRVVEQRRVGEYILFQGGTACNRAVTAAFRVVTGKKVLVPPHNEVTGALGMALLIRKAYRERPFETRFKGLDRSNLQYSIKTFVCRECANSCEVKQVHYGAERPLFYGQRCEKYEMVKKKKDSSCLDFTTVREQCLSRFVESGNQEGSGPRIGIALGLGFHETLPFWTTFFRALGCRVVFSGITNRTLIRSGIKRTTAETCFPVKVFHGHVEALLQLKPDYLFLPSVVNMPLEGSQSEHNFNCTMIQSSPYFIQAAFHDQELPHLLVPTLHWQYGPRRVLRELEGVRRSLGRSRRALAGAWRAAAQAQRAFETMVRQEAEQFMARQDGKPVVVLLGRPYNIYDQGLNLAIPRKLADLGVASIPFDALPGTGGGDHDWQDIYWRYGQRILGVLERIKSNPRLLPVYITNFSCGPDSFVLHYASHAMGERPILYLELDEHSADAGIITRLEAYLDSVGAGQRFPVTCSKNNRRSAGSSSLRKKKVFIPNMCDDAMPIAAAFRREGIDAEVLPEPDQRNIELGRKLTSGKECYPMAITTGDLFRIAERPDFQPGRTVFFMPTTNGPCRFGEYSRLQDLLLQRRGIRGIEIFSPSSGNGYEAMRELSSSFYFTIWKGMVCVDLLLKALMAIRPYEKTEGTTDAVYDSCLAELEQALEHNGTSLGRLMEKFCRRFQEIGVQREQRVRIGVVGEIYVRTNRFANGNVIRHMEQLGAEVVMAPFCEWSFYANHLSIRNHKQQGRLLGAASDYLKNSVQQGVEQRFARIFAPLGLFHEPRVLDVMRNAEQFLGNEIRGEAILTLGKAVDFARRGFAGILNLMPFSCMPGLIVSSLVPRFRARFHDMPWLNLAFEDSAADLDSVHLEAFLAQAKAYHESRVRGVAP